jgi:hypothetical protein
MGVFSVFVRATDIPNNALCFVLFCFVLFGLGPPESDSSEVQGVVFTVMTFPFIFVFQLLALLCMPAH